MNERQFVANAIRKIVRTELDYFPLAQPQDLAKLLYQAVYGPRHAVDNASALFDWLQDEMKIAQSYHHHLLLQELYIFQPMFRLYLGPAKEKGFSTELIHDLFWHSCQAKPITFTFPWEEILALTFNESGVNPENCLNLLTNEGPFHHSSLYREAYRPHYRLITMDAITSFPEVKLLLNLE